MQSARRRFCPPICICNLMAKSQTPVRFADTAVRLCSLVDLEEQPTCSICYDELVVSKKDEFSFECCDKRNGTIEANPSPSSMQACNIQAHNLNPRRCAASEMRFCFLAILGILRWETEPDKHKEEHDFVHGPSLTLTCGHSFHRACIQQWALINRNCPICRKQVLPTAPAPMPGHAETVSCLRVVMYIAAVLVIALIGGLANIYM
jgi:hypothetical protein